MVITAVPSRSKENVTPRQLSRTSKFVQGQIELASGSKNKDRQQKQVGSLIKSYGEEERRKILSNAGISDAEINEEELIAVKANLSIPWRKLFVMKEYVK